MSANSKIEWTETSWNPLRGCSRISPGCENCYAERMAARFSGSSGHALQCFDGFHGFAEMRNGKPHWTGRVELIPEKLTEPLHWRKPRKVFVNSMSDLFHESLPDEAIDQVFAVMALCPQHTFQVLTKRAKRMREWATRQHWDASIPDTCIEIERQDDQLWQNGSHELPWPLPNVHLGVSVESQKYADERIPELLATPAAVRWVSAEPLLEAVDFKALKVNQHLVNPPEPPARTCDCGLCKNAPPERDYHLKPLNYPTEINALTGEYITSMGIGYLGQRKLDWIVVGGESGPGARPFDLAWARSIIADCRDAGVPVFMKQCGANPYLTHHPEWADSIAASFEVRDCKFYLRLKSSKGGDPSEWPEDLRVREFPVSALRADGQAGAPIPLSEVAC